MCTITLTISVKCLLGYSTKKIKNSDGLSMNQFGKVIVI